MKQFSYVCYSNLIQILAVGTDAANVMKTIKNRKGYVTGVVLQFISHTPFVASGIVASMVALRKIQEQL